MKDSYLLKNETAKKLYKEVKCMPIADYHCHLSPKEIFEDKCFTDIGEMWLGGDHYKWRLMRLAGIDEEYITGNASNHDKFLAYAKAVQFAAGSPLYHWSHMELSMYFGIDENLNENSAEDIWNRANAYIKENKISPRSLIKQSNVSYIGTTDDIIDNLFYHEKLAEQKDKGFDVCPSFRTDNLLLIKRDGYADYIKTLSDVSGIYVDNINSLKAAVIDRLDFFCDHGCKFTDVGIPFFPDSIAKDCEADETFKKALSGEEISDEEYKAFLGNMYLFLGAEYKKRNLVMQWHLAVQRNANSDLFKTVGPDAGGDCIGDLIKIKDITYILDSINSVCGLPETILYTLTPALASALAVAAGSFRNVRCGAAWWFCDHLRGIIDEINIIAESMNLGTFLGMLTDSRSFLSYARHDYFRRILCNVIGEWVEADEYDKESAVSLAKRICFNNIDSLIKGE